MNKPRLNQTVETDDSVFLKLGERAFDEWNSAENDTAFATLALTAPTKTLQHSQIPPLTSRERKKNHGVSGATSQSSNIAKQERR